MDEPLLNNANSNIDKDRKESFLMSFAKKVIDNVNQDMNIIDYTINTLLFGHQFDLLFVEHDHSQTLEWRKFTTNNSNNQLPQGVQETVLRNDMGLAALYSQARTRGVPDEAFWRKWLFFRFLQDQQSQKQQSNKSESTLLSNIKKEDLEEWD